MQLADGFKQTEVGVIPEDWRCVASGDFVRYFGGNAFSSKSQTESGVRWLKIANVGIQNARWDDVTYLPNEFVQQFPAFKLSDGDVVMALTRPILSGKLKVARLGARDVPALLNQRVARIIPNEECDLNYIYQTLQLPYFVDCMNVAMAGTDPPNIGSGALNKIPIAVPPTKKEQRAIAEALSDVDALINALDALITKKRHIKQGTMQQLLTGKKRLPGFSGEFATTTFEEVVDDFSSGSTPSRLRPDFYEGNIRWITSSELNYNVIMDTVEKVTAEAVEKTCLKVHRPGTFLMAITGLEAAGTRGSCGIVGAESTTNQSCMALTPGPRLTSRYLFHYYVQNGDFLALRYCQGTKQQSYTARIAKKLPITLPPTTAEQDAIASVLDDMDAEITALEQKRDKTKLIKQGMMQELLTGKTRLI